MAKTRSQTKSLGHNDARVNDTFHDRPRQDTVDSRTIPTVSMSRQKQQVVPINVRRRGQAPASRWSKGLFPQSTLLSRPPGLKPIMYDRTKALLEGPSIGSFSPTMLARAARAKKAGFVHINNTVRPDVRCTLDELTANPGEQLRTYSVAEHSAAQALMLLKHGSDTFIDPDSPALALMPSVEDARDISEVPWNGASGEHESTGKDKGKAREFDFATAFELSGDDNDAVDGHSTTELRDKIKMEDVGATKPKRKASTAPSGKPTSERISTMTTNLPAERIIRSHARATELIKAQHTTETYSSSFEQPTKLIKKPTTRPPTKPGSKTPTTKATGTNIQKVINSSIAVPANVTGLTAHTNALALGEHFEVGIPRPTGTDLALHKLQTKTKWVAYPKAVNWSDEASVRKLNRWRQQKIRRAHKKLGINRDGRSDRDH